ncbi:MAG: hypothetical protein Q3972_06970 [Corynebacterium sp.]|nr:hypothetical protein [Corynebacterium sp.]
MTTRRGNLNLRDGLLSTGSALSIIGLLGALIAHFSPVFEGVGFVEFLFLATGVGILSSMVIYDLLTRQRPKFAKIGTALSFVLSFTLVLSIGALFF